MEIGDLPQGEDISENSFRVHQAAFIRLMGRSAYETQMLS